MEPKICHVVFKRRTGCLSIFSFHSKLALMKADCAECFFLDIRRKQKKMWLIKKRKNCQGCLTATGTLSCSLLPALLGLFTGSPIFFLLSTSLRNSPTPYAYFTCYKKKISAFSLPPLFWVIVLVPPPIFSFAVLSAVTGDVCVVCTFTENTHTSGILREQRLGVRRTTVSVHHHDDWYCRRDCAVTVSGRARLLGEMLWLAPVRSQNVFWLAAIQESCVSSWDRVQDCSKWGILRNIRLDKSEDSIVPASLCDQLFLAPHKHSPALGSAWEVL